MFYPLRFYPIYKEKVWGGNNLSAKIGRNLFSTQIGESWDISCQENGISIVANGMLEGENLPTLVEKYPVEVLGTDLYHLRQFPLLVKLLDCNDKLSVQVHPDDQYAQRNENVELGKNEMWFVLEAELGAQLVYGLKAGTTKETLKYAVEQKRIKDYLCHVPVKQGDIFYIKAGTVHALEKGIVLLEIQQTSDITYRLYDWDRADNTRELHIDKALDVIDFSITADGNRKNINSISEGLLIDTDYYKAELLVASRKLKQNTEGRKFHILSIVNGEGKVICGDFVVPLVRGDSILIPAVVGQYFIEGDNEFKVIKAYC